MNFFKKKPQHPAKKKTSTMQVTIKAPRWKPPFPNAGKRQQINPIDVTNAISDKPEIIKEKPTYILPASKETTVSPSKKKEGENKAEISIGPSIRKDFLKTFRDLTYRHRSWDIWSDFVTMAACAISNSVDKSHFDEREETYLRIIKKYTKEEQELFPKLFAITVLALEDNPEQDFLGEVYTELGLNSKEHQQIFTPYHIAHFMAEITMTDLDKAIEEKGFVTVHDSCCGGGVTLIAAVNVAKEQLGKKEMNFQNHLLVTGQDIDPIVAMMCYIQLSLLGVAGYFKVGNSLTEPMSTNDDLTNYWFTPMYFFPAWHFRRIFSGFDKAETKE